MERKIEMKNCFFFSEKPRSQIRDDTSAECELQNQLQFSEHLDIANGFLISQQKISSDKYKAETSYNFESKN